MAQVLSRSEVKKMVKITINLSQSYDTILQKMAEENKRSKRNELLILIEKHLSKHPLNAKNEVLEAKDPYVENIAGMECNTFFAQGKE